MLLLTLAVLSLGSQVNGILPILLGVGIPQNLQNLWRVAEFVHALGGKVKDSYDVYDASTDDTDKKIDKILSEVSAVSAQIGGFESRLNRRLDVMMESLFSRLTLTEKLNAAIADVHKNIVMVDGLWENYLAYSKNLSIYHNNTIKAFIDTAIGMHGGLQSWLTQIYGVFIPGRTGPVMESLFLIRQQIEKVSQLFNNLKNPIPPKLKNEKLSQEFALMNCDEGLSPQLQLYQLYDMAALTELRGYIMGASAYGLQARFDKVKYTAEVDIIESRFISRTKDYMLSVKAAMNTSSNIIRRCDPKGGHKEGQTYAEMRRLFQTYLVNEADMNSADACQYDCTMQPDTTNLRRVNYAETYRDQPDCNGIITKCAPATREIDICILGDGYRRRYQWIRDADGNVWGNDTECHGTKRTLSSWRRAFVFCDYCLCTCEATRKGNPTQGIINFLPSQANIDENMVVVGMKIVKEDNVIHIQIREGKLLANGQIMRDSERWVGVRHLKLETSGSYTDEGVILQQGVDYDSIHREGRRVNLDDVVVPKGHVVIGARFQHELDSKIHDHNPIRLEIWSIPFDYATGTLSPKEFARWRSGQPSQKRESVKFDKPMDPLQNPQNVPSTKANLYVDFQQTNPKKDAGQATIPFWDIQPVVTSPSFPLEGVGLFHKGDKEGQYGGYLALRLHTYNFIDKINSNISETLNKKYHEVLAKLVGFPMAM
ncbi:uncharacterized protein LOC135172686 isoform X2 [Diachasmimorpha longicaudata]|uniref:uncharacterized protein LOC135172686 isoform X2 n=1 Tax=Diachasmimorpha longicaudata TaxID=58733 RepID=UPI0030B86E2F